MIHGRVFTILSVEMFDSTFLVLPRWSAFMPLIHLCQFVHVHLFMPIHSRHAQSLMPVHIPIHSYLFIASCTFIRSFIHSFIHSCPLIHAHSHHTHSFMPTHPCPFTSCPLIHAHSFMPIHIMPTHPCPFMFLPGYLPAYSHPCWAATVAWVLDPPHCRHLTCVNGACVYRARGVWAWQQ